MEGATTVQMTAQELQNANASRTSEVALALALENEQLHKFIAKEDAAIIYKSTKGWGTDEKELINVLCNRTKKQLGRIDLVCHNEYSKSLLEWVGGDVSGSFGKMVKYALKPVSQLGAELLLKATDGMGTNVSSITDLVSIYSNEELAGIKAIYEAKYNKSLVDTLNSEFGSFSQNAKNLLTMQFLGKKSESTAVNEALAVEQAKALHKAGVGRIGTDEKTFVEILGGQSQSQIQAIKRAYERNHGMSLMNAIKKETSRALETALLATLYPNRPAYIASALRSAFEGPGTNKRRVCRLLGAVDKKEMKAVNKYYLETYGETLEEALRKETLIYGTFMDAATTWVKAWDYTHGVEDELAALPDADDDVSTKAKALLLLKEREMLREFMAFNDAKNIQKACKGMGTKDRELIDLICGRTKEHLKAVNLKYHELFKRSLGDQIDGETSGDYRRMLRYCVMQEDEFDALIIKEACDGIGTDEMKICETLAPYSNGRINRLRLFYEQRYGKPLIDRLNSELSGSLKTICVKLLMAERDEEGGTSEDKAKNDAQALHEGGVAKWGTDDSLFITLFTKSSRAHIQGIKDQYERLHGISMQKAIEKEMSGHFKRVLLALLRSPVDYRVWRLRQAFEGIGSDKKAICRVLGGQEKNKVKQMSDRYLEIFGETVLERLKKETSGKLRLACMTWVAVSDPMHNDALQQALIGMENDVDDAPPPPPVGQGGLAVAVANAVVAPPAPGELIHASAYNMAYAHAGAPLVLMPGQTQTMQVGQCAMLNAGMFAMVQMGLGWRTNPQAIGGKVDLDASCIMFDGRGNMVEKVFFHNQRGPGVFHSGDNRQGGAGGSRADDESITVNLNEIPPYVCFLAFVVNIFSQKASFADVNSCYVSLRAPTGGSLADFHISPSTPTKGLVMTILRRASNGAWLFQPVGEGCMGRRCDTPETISAVQDVLCRPAFVKMY